jgi:hypothetical protein
MLGHFAPNESFISYEILINFLEHRIKVYYEEQQTIQTDALYYTLHDPEVLKLVEMNDRIIEEYEWLLEFVKENYKLLTF